MNDPIHEDREALAREVYETMERRTAELTGDRAPMVPWDEIAAELRKVLIELGGQLIRRLVKRGWRRGERVASARLDELEARVAALEAITPRPTGT